MDHIMHDPMPTTMEHESHETQPPICNLPAEIFDIICSSTDSTRSLMSLRRTCKALHAKTEEMFMKRHFATMQTTLTDGSLRYIERVSRSKYAEKVQVLQVKPKYLGALAIHVQALFQTQLPPVEKLALEAEQRGCKNGEDVRVLSAALTKLTNLTCIEVLPYDDDSPDAMVQAHFSVLPNSTLIKALSHAFSVVLRSLASAPSVKVLRAGLAPEHDGIVRHTIDEVALTTQVQRQALTNLESFRLYPGITAGKSNSDCEQKLAALLHQMPNLKSLHLEFWGYNVDWLSETFAKVSLPQLKDIRIEAARQVSASQLASFIRRHSATLESVTIQLVTFVDDDLCSVFPTIFKNLRINRLHLQQLASAQHGLLLIGGDSSRICEPCYQDLEGNWRFEKPTNACEHASVAVSGDEREVNQVLAERLTKLDLLPWRQIVIRTPQLPQRIQTRSMTGDKHSSTDVAPNSRAYLPPTNPQLEDRSPPRKKTKMVKRVGSGAFVFETPAIDDTWSSVETPASDDAWSSIEIPAMDDTWSSDDEDFNEGHFDGEAVVAAREGNREARTDVFGGVDLFKEEDDDDVGTRDIERHSTTLEEEMAKMRKSKKLTEAQADTSNDRMPTFALRQTRRHGKK